MVLKHQHAALPITFKAELHQAQPINSIHEANTFALRIKSNGHTNTSETREFLLQMGGPL